MQIKIRTNTAEKAIEEIEAIQGKYGEKIVNVEIEIDESYEDLRINSNYVYVVKTIVSGEIVEKEIYPVWKRKGDMSRGKKEEEVKKGTGKSQ